MQTYSVLSCSSSPHQLLKCPYIMRSLFCSSHQFTFQMRRSLCNLPKTLHSLSQHCKPPNYTIPTTSVTHFIKHDAYTWNTQLRTSLEENNPRAAVLMYAHIRRRGVVIDSYTLVFAIKACGLIDPGTLEGKQLHAQVSKSGFGSDLIIQTALLKMYGLFSDLAAAQQVFDETPQRDVVQWNALIAAYAQRNQPGKAILAANSMMDENVRPWLEHYGSMVDLLCRAGLVREAFEFAVSVPMKPDVVMWRILIGACRDQGNISLARQVADYVIRLEPEHSGNYILKSNLHATNEDWVSVSEVRSDMGIKGVAKKDPARSHIEVN